MTRVDIAGVDNAARCGKGGHCGSGQCRSGQIGNMGSSTPVIGYFNNRFMDFNGLFVAALMDNLNT